MTFVQDGGGGKGEVEVLVPAGLRFNVTCFEFRKESIPEVGKPRQADILFLKTTFSFLCFF